MSLALSIPYKITLPQTIAAGPHRMFSQQYSQLKYLNSVLYLAQVLV